MTPFRRSTVRRLAGAAAFAAVTTGAQAQAINPAPPILIFPENWGVLSTKSPAPDVPSGASQIVTSDPSK